MIYNCKQLFILLIIYIFGFYLFYKIKMFIFVKNPGYGRKIGGIDETRGFDFESPC